MAQSDYNIANAPGAAVRADINSQLEAIASKNSSVNAPVPSFPFMWWMDETANVLRIRNSANSAWLPFATYDPVSGTWQFGVLFASQAEAEAGVENTKAMTSLRVAQAAVARQGEIPGRVPLWENTRFNKVPYKDLTAGTYVVQPTDRGSILRATVAGVTIDARQSSLGAGFVIGVMASNRTVAYTLADSTANANLFDVSHDGAETLAFTGLNVHWFACLNGTWIEIACGDSNLVDLPLLSTPAQTDIVEVMTPSTGARRKAPVSSLKPTALSQLTNDTGFISGIPAAGVGQVQLRTGFAAHTFSGSGNNSMQYLASYTLTGGEWLLGLTARKEAGAHTFSIYSFTYGNLIIDSVSDGIGVTETAGESSWGNLFGRSGDGDNGGHPLVASLCERYVSGSPPYDFGDGETDAFVFLLVEKGSGRVISTSFSNDPPWMYNGPTKCRADVYVDSKGREFDALTAAAGRIPVTPMIRRHKTSQTFEEAKKGGPKALAKHFDERLHGDTILQPVTMQMKMADMSVFPHPFGLVKPNQKVVIVDPMSPMARKLMAIHHEAEAGQHPSQFFFDETMKLNNDDLAVTKKRCGPPGVQITSVNFR